MIDPDRTPAADPGDAFEEYFWGLLRRRYSPADLVYIPAEMGGDCGIEGFSTDGIAYQAYADRDSANLRHRTDKQKQKLYRDTEKLKKNAVKLESMLDGVVLQSYFLLVPEYHASELIEYAAKRAGIIRGYNLSFISSNFSIRLKTPHDYPAEFQAALQDDTAKVLIHDLEIPNDYISEFEGNKPALAQTLDGKLEQLKEQIMSVNIAPLRNKLIRAFLVKQKIMDSLTSWPATWEAIELQRQLRQEHLELESELDPTPSNQRILGLIKEYEKELLTNVGGIRPGDAQRLAMGQVGEWLMRCPLSFGGGDV
ncbi:hypothetical protein HFP15_28295 [Amycolatopsis sp. K13G38]|uniref:Uncharacterized protein n=1 Tax=Amycolatopsis acididurans TaxID=2724524 RepID=A0ABX1JAI0_9PSEU|nr:hypothetical protein [Amycolatopsis acididurans]NKQ56778.1 hypothetical protein [Amycolatopsis acididurans]